MQAVLKSTSSEEWLQAVLNDFDTFLIDHAACERKASAMAVTFVVRYPDKAEILEPMIQLAREELTHFYRVFKLLQSRKLRFTGDKKDPYVNALLRKIPHNPKTELLDRLLVAGVIEARGYERFNMVAERHADPALRDFYRELGEHEDRHADLFVDLAKCYYDEDVVARRLEWWLELEAEAIAAVPPRAAVH